jgi:hypothetical protein
LSKCPSLKQKFEALCIIARDCYTIAINGYIRLVCYKYTKNKYKKEI